CECRSGDIVLAYIDDGFTLKTYRNKNGKIWLEPANKNYPNLYPKEKLEIFGVINGVIRKV
ncbi:MAG: S24 family peptidase, partial [bacterium]|nr:S24 family peptidase [bacterium]